MEAILSVLAALFGLILVLMFLLDAIGIVKTGVVSRKELIICLIKLLAALLLLHFHFELDIFE